MNNGTLIGVLILVLIFGIFLVYPLTKNLIERIKGKHKIANTGDKEKSQHFRFSEFGFSNCEINFSSENEQKVLEISGFKSIDDFKNNIKSNLINSKIIFKYEKLIIFEDKSSNKEYWYVIENNLIKCFDNQEKLENSKTFSLRIINDNIVENRKINEFCSVDIYYSQIKK